MTTFNGNLDITVSDAQIMSSQLGSKQDPYCVVTLGSSGLKNLMEGERFGKEKFQTKVHDGAGQHPVWNESHSLSLNKMTFDSHLKVKIYDKDVLKDDYIGVAKINLDQLMRVDGKGVQYYPVYKKGTFGSTSGSIGQVGVGVKFNCTEIPQGRGDLKTTSTMGTTQSTLGTTQVGTTQAPTYQHTQAPLGAYQQGYTQAQQVPSTQQAPMQKGGLLGAITGAIIGQPATHSTGQTGVTGQTGFGQTGFGQTGQTGVTGVSGQTGVAQPIPMAHTDVSGTRYQKGGY